MNKRRNQKARIKLKWEIKRHVDKSNGVTEQNSPRGARINLSPFRVAAMPPSFREKTPLHQTSNITGPGKRPADWQHSASRLRGQPTHWIAPITCFVRKQSWLSQWESQGQIWLGSFKRLVIRAAFSETTRFVPRLLLASAPPRPQPPVISAPALRERETFGARVNKARKCPQNDHMANATRYRDFLLDLAPEHGRTHGRCGFCNRFSQFQRLTRSQWWRNSLHICKYG